MLLSFGKSHLFSISQKHLYPQPVVCTTSQRMIGKIRALHLHNYYIIPAVFALITIAVVLCLIDLHQARFRLDIGFSTTLNISLLCFMYIANCILHLKNDRPTPIHLMFSFPSQGFAYCLFISFPDIYLTGTNGESVL